MLVADGDGNLRGTQTISYGSGQLTVSGATGGTICTSGNGVTVTFSLVLVGGGNGPDRTVKLSETSPNYSVLGIGDRQ